METPIKRFKFDDSNEDALNLTLTSYKACPNTSSEHQNGEEMKKKFQEWVIETYKDSSKTKTITTKKYERILKTLQGEIKNCAENSKFRFWMKCKGFKLETHPSGDKILSVQDRKGDELKYKRVAVVENFFDIIYKVHVNEGARGVQHAGQKRTHRTITETYAFLPREAVTKFLLFCSKCQKRTSEERKCSPNSSSCDSINDRLATIGSSNSSLKIDGTDPNFSHPHNDDPKITTSPNHTNHNNYLISGADDFSQSYNSCGENIPEPNRRRKRKFIRKIIRPSNEPLHVHFKNYLEESVTPLDLVQRNINSIPPNTQFTPHPASPRETKHEKFATPGPKTHFTTKSISPSFVKNCPYVTRLSKILHDPAQYAEYYFKEGFSHPSVDHDFMEQVAVNLITKVRHLEVEKNSLTEDEKHQLSLKVHSCRISSFLLNYAADLILRSVIR